MKTNLLKPLLACSALCAFTLTSLFGAPKVGEPAPAFSVTDIAGKTHQLSDFKGKTVVLEWVNPECPFVVKHYDSGNMPALQKSAAAAGVVWISINSAAPGKQGDFDAAKVASWSEKTGAAPAAYVRDTDGKLGKLYAAKTTPQMFVIKADGVLAYAGAIDSIKSAEQADIAKSTNYVTTALAALKAGKNPEPSATQPYGCGVKY